MSDAALPPYRASTLVAGCLVDAALVDHVNVVLNTDADTSGSKIVVVDDGSANALKFVTDSATLFAALCREHAVRVRVVKLKGVLSSTDADEVAGALRDVGAAQRAAPGGAVLHEVVAKGAVCVGTAAAALAAALAEALPAGATLVPAKKVELSAAAAAALPVAALAALFAGGVPPAAPASRAAGACAVKAKLKLGAGVGGRLLDAGALACLAQPCTALGAPVAPVDQLKLRGPVTAHAAAALAAALAALSAVGTVKLARFWSADADAADGVAAALVAAAASRPLRLALKCKGRGKADAPVAADARPADVAALLRSLEGEAPPG